MAKGASFEREICKQLSLWWTDNERDDIFWRSSNSGGRAKVRSKKGKRTSGQEGDICATDPIGLPLIQLCAIECKRGYKQVNMGNMLDCPARRSQAQPWMKFIKQVTTDQKNGSRPYWMLITKRNQCEPIIHIPRTLYAALSARASKKPLLSLATPSLLLRMPAEKAGKAPVRVFATTLTVFLSVVTPVTIKRIHRATM